jgi:hypothetical protein
VTLLRFKKGMADEPAVTKDEVAPTPAHENTVDKRPV